MKRQVYHAVWLCSIFCLAASSGYVPVMMWTNIGSEQCDSANIPVKPAEYVLELSESEYFRCLEKSNPKVIKVFVTEELDESDFSCSHYENGNSKAFNHLQSILQSTSHVVMPAVQPSSISTFLSATLKKSFKDADFSAIELPEIDRLNLGQKQRSIAILDEMINEELLKLPPGQEYIAVLTARSAPQHLPRSDNEVRFGRQLLAMEDSPVGENKTKFLNFDDCIYIAYTNVTLKYQKDVYNLTNGRAPSGDCSMNDTRSLKLNFDVFDNSTAHQVSVSFSFIRKKYPASGDTWWSINSTLVEHNLNGTLVNYSFKIADHYLYSAPANWSWVCALPDKMFWIGGTKDSPIVQHLQFYNLQLQPFDITNSSFSRALDCSGFLTAPIWMGTVISLLLAVIFAFGIAALAAVTTMDRFDDPRGKTIQVHTHDTN